MIHSRALFGYAIFLGSFLLFLVEPMAARQLLPIFGGSAAVWITCLVFFQFALLCAYLYAHWLTRYARSGWNQHFALLLLASIAALLWAACQPGTSSSPAHPFFSIFTALAASIGLPFLALGATSPLLQVWFARSQSCAVPYRFFALSNVASLLALTLYPAWIEPSLTLHAQRMTWAICFLVFGLISAALAWKTRSAIQHAHETEILPEAEIPDTPLASKLLWLLLPMGAAMQLAAVTRHLTENIAAIPLLWILPLAVYLITLILAFQFPALLASKLGRLVVSRLLVVLLAGLGFLLSKPEVSLPLWLNIAFFLLELFAACLFCHAEACALRPIRPSETTSFYLLFGAGGALGSFLIGIASPMLFSFNYDLAIAFFLTAALALAVTWSVGWPPRLLWTTASALLLALVFFLRISFERNTPVAVRNFYGSLRVRQTVGYPGAVIRTLSNGTIEHGTQIFSDTLRHTPTTYYAEDSGIGLAMRNCCQVRPVNASRIGRNIGIIGLGAGTLAAYARRGDRFRFYEINPAVIPIAQNLFTYIRDAGEAGAQVEIVEGDARNSLSRESPQRFDILVIDAFSGDAIPLHLLTIQALALYKTHLAPGGILAFHISNQHIDLEPEIALLSKAAGMRAVIVSSSANEERDEFNSTWMLVSADPAFFHMPEVFNQATQPIENPKVRLWTDNYSSLLPIVRW